MWKILTVLIATSLMGLSGGLLADEGKTYTAAEAETEIMAACIRDKDNSEAQCVCVLGGLKAELPPKEYKFMMNIIAFAMNADLSSIWSFAWKNNLSLDRLEQLGKALEEVGDTLDKKCDNPNLKLDLDI